MAETTPQTSDSITDNDPGIAGEDKVKRKMEPRAKRNLFIIGGVFGFLVLSLGALSFFSDSTQPNERSAIKASNTETRVGETSQVYKDLQQQENQRREEEARRTAGQSFLPTVIEGAGDDRLAEIEEPRRNEVKMVPTPSGGPKERAIGQDTTQNADYLLAADPLENPRVARRYDAQMAQMAALMQANSPVGHQTQIVIPGYELDDRQLARQEQLRLRQAEQDEAVRQLAVAQQQATEQQSAQNQPPLYGSQLLKSAYVSLDKPIEADYDRLVVATVLTGLYQGAKLQGQGTRQADRLNVIFTQMVYKGQVYPINAVGLDNDSMSGMIEGDYESEWFDRLVMPFMFGLGAGIAEAQGETGTQVVVGVNGQLAQAQNEPSNREAVARGIAEGLRSTQSIYQETVRRPTVSTDINRNLIVVWLATGV